MFAVLNMGILHGMTKPGSSKLKANRPDTGRCLYNLALSKRNKKQAMRKCYFAAPSAGYSQTVPVSFASYSRRRPKLMVVLCSPQSSSSTALVGIQGTEAWLFWPFLHAYLFSSTSLLHLLVIWETAYVCTRTHAQDILHEHELVPAQNWAQMSYHLSNTGPQ